MSTGMILIEMCRLCPLLMQSSSFKYAIRFDMRRSVRSTKLLQKTFGRRQLIQFKSIERQWLSTHRCRHIARSQCALSVLWLQIPLFCSNRPEWNEFMEVQRQIRFEIERAFSNANPVFAPLFFFLMEEGLGASRAIWLNCHLRYFYAYLEHCSILLMDEVGYG